MADAKHVSEAFAEESKMFAIDPTEMLNRTNSSASIATEAFLSANETSQDASETSGTIETLIPGSGSTLIASQTNCGVPKDEQQLADDDSTAPLIPTRYEDFAKPVNVIDNRTFQTITTEIYESLSCCSIATCYIREGRLNVSCYNHYTRKMRNSKLILPVLAVLLLIPVSSIYFGVSFKESCPMSRLLPLLLILMGIVGVVFIAFRLVTLSARRCLRNVKKPHKAISISLTFMLVASMALEMFNIYSKTPVFDNPKDPMFCEKTFYDYVFYMNFAVLVIGILTLLLHIPKKPDFERRVIAQEHLDAV